MTEINANREASYIDNDVYNISVCSEPAHGMDRVGEGNGKHSLLEVLSVSIYLKWKAHIT